MKFKSLPLLLILLVLASCDYFYNAQVRNDTQVPIQLTIQFNKDSLEKYWSNVGYMAYLKSYPGHDNIQAIAFDSVTLTKTFIVKPQSMFPVEGGTTRPDFALIDKIIINGKDRIVLDGETDIKNAFKQTHKYLLELVVR